MTIIGIDVSKSKLDCLWIRDLSKLKVKSKVQPNTPKGHRALLDWAIQLTGEPVAGLHFVMEATGVYHEALAYALYDAGAQVSVVNPTRIRDFAKSLGAHSKNDRKDSVVIARYGMTQSPILWEPEPKEVRELKALLARYEAVKQDIEREWNRLEKAQVSQSSAQVRTSIEHVREQLDRERKRLESLIDDHIDNHPGLKQDRALLESIPGVGPTVSQQMVAVLRSRRFEKASQCAAFLGLIPIERESGTSVKKPPRLSKFGDGRIRAKLYMAAMVATRHNTVIQAQYRRLVRRGKSRMAAIGAAMRKLVHLCYGVLKHQTPYQPQAV
ncbi:IS110 family transposase [Parahaliea mediterranea]|uniref:IS110 family transposase n=1 Tax=Parahaliea mediterranea TaxID=651086 RepID=A0A939DJ41_9GAMM|nr:IS110 family transposase [Parahaliea mediterranea]